MQKLRKARFLPITLKIFPIVVIVGLDIINRVVTLDARFHREVAAGQYQPSLRPNKPPLDTRRQVCSLTQIHRVFVFISEELIYVHRYVKQIRIMISRWSAI